MKNPLQYIILENFTTHSGKVYDIPLCYQVFGKNLEDAPIVLVKHALTGNSDVAGENGWWKTLIGEEKIIDTNQFSVLCFNIPGLTAATTPPLSNNAFIREETSAE